MKEWQAVEYAVTHDDGMNIDNLDGAEILIVDIKNIQNTYINVSCK